MADRKSLKDRVTEMQDSMQKAEQKAQRLDGEKEAALKHVENKVGTRDIKEAREKVRQWRERLDREGKELTDEVDNLEREIKEKEESDDNSE